LTDVGGQVRAHGEKAKPIPIGNASGELKAISPGQGFLFTVVIIRSADRRRNDGL
jgi:hypothetical protein